MNLTYVPLLQLQRQLYDLPRGRDRFENYLRTMRSGDGSGLELPPLVIMNPMAREHVPALLDALLAIDADEIAARAIAEAADDLNHGAGDFKVALVIADDLKGGWTNRYASEFNLRFPHLARTEDGLQPPHWSTVLWLSAVLWSSENASAQAVREAVLTAVYRAAYIARHGHALTLRDMLTQEGWAMARAGCTEPVLDDDDLAYTREVISVLLDAGDTPTLKSSLGKTTGSVSPWRS